MVYECRPKKFYFNEIAQKVIWISLYEFLEVFQKAVKEYKIPICIIFWTNKEDNITCHDFI